MKKEFYVVVAPANYNTNCIGEGHRWIDLGGSKVWDVLLVGKKEARETLEGVKADYWPAHPKSEPPFCVKTIWSLIGTSKKRHRILTGLKTYEELDTVAEPHVGSGQVPHCVYAELHSSAIHGDFHSQETWDALPGFIQHTILNAMAVRDEMLEGGIR